MIRRASNQATHALAGNLAATNRLRPPADCPSSKLQALRTSARRLQFVGQTPKATRVSTAGQGCRASDVLLDHLRGGKCGEGVDFLPASEKVDPIEESTGRCRRYAGASRAMACGGSKTRRADTRPVARHHPYRTEGADHGAYGTRRSGCSRAPDARDCARSRNRAGVRLQAARFARSGCSAVPEPSGPLGTGGLRGAGRLILGWLGRPGGGPVRCF
jgi:hypothetical protein